MTINRSITITVNDDTIAAIKPTRATTTVDDSVEVVDEGSIVVSVGTRVDCDVLVVIESGRGDDEGQLNVPVIVVTNVITCAFTKEIEVLLRDRINAVTVLSRKYYVIAFSLTLGACARGL